MIVKYLLKKDLIGFFQLSGLFPNCLNNYLNPPLFRISGKAKGLANPKANKPGFSQRDGFAINPG
jgi:hypothetical protein